MSSRRFSETPAMRDRLNALLAITGYVYEAGERTRYNLRGLILAFLSAEKSISGDGNYLIFRVRSRIPITQENLKDLESDASL